MGTCGRWHHRTLSPNALLNPGLGIITLSNFFLLHTLSKARDLGVDISGGVPLRILAAGHGFSAVRSCDRHGVDVDVRAAAALAAVKLDGRLVPRSPLQVRVRYVAHRHRPLRQIKIPRRRRTNISTSCSTRIQIVQQLMNTCTTTMFGTSRRST